ncbi:MAG: rhamnulokinase [Thermoleophilaceae bacterium]
MRRYLAIDLGAESGRGVVGDFDGERIALRTCHRFANVPVRLPDGLHWNAVGIFQSVEEALGRAPGGVASVGVDSWAVDFGLIDADGGLLGTPFHYRDERTAAGVEKALSRVPAREIYEATGIQFIPINTLYQLLAMEGSSALAAAKTLLMIPDLIAYWLTGERASEVTVASTTQLYDPRAGSWALELAERLGVPTAILPELRGAGTTLAPLRPDVAERAALGSPPRVVTVAAHDTASAVAAVPAAGADFAYISSGTWSLVGVELEAPLIDAAAMEANFSNEQGLAGTTRFLRNVMGLWLVQECRRAWEREGRRYAYDDLVRLAEEAEPGGPLIDPDAPGLLRPGDMPERIAALCARGGRELRGDPGALVRCVLESLACQYRLVVDQAEALTGRRADTIHVVGGGARNGLLCQLTADVCGRPVLAGPFEATALGNLMVQALADSEVSSPAEIRAVVRRSSEIRTHEPGGDGRGGEIFARFRELVADQRSSAGVGVRT